MTVSLLLLRILTGSFPPRLVPLLHAAHEPTVRIQNGDLPEPVENQPFAGHVQPER